MLRVLFTMMKLMTRPGVWIWMIGVMVLTGTGIAALLLLSPPGPGQDLTLVRLALLIAASALIAVPFSRGISKSMTAPVT